MHYPPLLGPHQQLFLVNHTFTVKNLEWRVEGVGRGDSEEGGGGWSWSFSEPRLKPFKNQKRSPPAPHVARAHLGAVEKGRIRPTGKRQVLETSLASAIRPVSDRSVLKSLPPSELVSLWRRASGWPPPPRLLLPASLHLLIDLALCVVSEKKEGMEGLRAQSAQESKQGGNHSPGLCGSY